MRIFIITRRTLLAVGLGLLLLAAAVGFGQAAMPTGSPGRDSPALETTADMGEMAHADGEVHEHPVDAEYAMTLQARGKERPIYSARTTEKIAALTFDISWGTKMYPKVLQVLQQTQTPATFFLSGPWSSQHPEAVAAIKAGGFEIQSHGHKHVDFDELTAAQVAENIQATHKILSEMAGAQPTLIRPPNGAFDDESIVAARGLGYETVIWSVDSLDWKNPGVSVITNRVLKKIHPGAIILMHASDSCKQTDQALPVVLAGLKAQGYRLVTLSELMKFGVDPEGHIH
jgi:polysaccharide deacetylase family sporulation protein PdaB